ncbi:MAG: PfkB family carbohydrate kinase [Hydrogenophaga sp.]|uniref:PfkB family carbohydrate kinase n=1 Tax=Comamonadaceae TaxID=80864 RepID=UPI0027306795|nr:MULTISPECIES: PfkB family carbohydrate kinase [Comamonadaceae]MDP2440215.1 PfkB family carbohydrate kinase [Rhodoferax sp.]MDZ4174369.1 PfkB family carbohydrate kinase [Hydrogenophaga sp.]
MSSNPGIAVIGGVYEERCLRPDWYEVYGSAGRACSAIAAVDDQVAVALHCYADPQIQEALAARSALERTQLHVTAIANTMRFVYVHGLDRPQIENATSGQPVLTANAANVLRFGMLEGDAVVDGGNVVYDPQNALSPAVFHANGSRADRLAVVVNENEARSMTGLCDADIDELTVAVRDLNGAEIVVVKRGPLGAVVFDGAAHSWVPALHTKTVWKIGSGDIFSAHFALNWAVHGRDPVESAQAASRATASYCETGGFPTAQLLQRLDAKPVVPSDQFMTGRVPRVYLAAPFFTLAQLWIVEQTRMQLQHFGLDVFSPYHDVGLGPAEKVVEADLQGLRDVDFVFAIAEYEGTSHFRATASKCQDWFWKSI